jgi:hypothetical protein
MSFSLCIFEAKTTQWTENCKFEYRIYYVKSFNNWSDTWTLEAQ